MNIGRTLSRPILIVRGEGIASWFGEDIFDLPEALALASEGFCPYHRDGEAVPVKRLPDGRVECSVHGARQTWEWSEEPVLSTDRAATDEEIAEADRLFPPETASG